MKELYLKYKAVFQEYGVADIASVAAHWQEVHRFYHNEEHLDFLIRGVEKLFETGRVQESERNILLMSAYFHDAIYDPTAQDNEEKSADYFIQHSQPHIHSQSIKEIILDTKTHEPKSELSKLFNDLDMFIVSNTDFPDLLEWEYKIFKEFQFIDYSIYKSVRIGLLKKFAKEYPENTVNLYHLIDYLEKHRPKVGIYPGSFNPFHNGHLNILEKSEKIFDKVIVARGINPDKEDINTNHLKIKTLKYRQQENFIGFLTDYIYSKEQLSDVTLIRGLRSGDDLDYEINQLRFMEEMKADLKIIFIACDKQYEHISSSGIKNLERIREGSGKMYLPE